MSEFEETPQTVLETILYNIFLPIAALIAAKVSLTSLYNYVMSLFVDGKPNEWVLIMRNGKMVKAAVGMRCFKGPFDQVARFPAKIYKVDFTTEQVTNEMQGVRVCGMLVWTVNRIGDGPFNAYKNLGDISSGNPRTANESLIAMSSAVVRGCIANSTIVEMITNRKLLRDAIHKEMFDVVKGWGVWLETIEITNVTCCSQSLFRDMQTNYRESMRQQATLHQMQIKEEIDKVQSQNGLEIAQKEREAAEKEKLYVDKIKMEQEEATQEFKRANGDIMQEKAEIEVQHDIAINIKKEDFKRKLADIKLQLKLEQDQTHIKEALEKTRLIKEENASYEKALQFELETKKIAQDSQNEEERAMLELEKTNMDAQMLSYETIKLAKQCYSGKYFTSVNITSMPEDDVSGAVLAGVLSKLDVTKKAIGQ